MAAIHVPQPHGVVPKVEALRVAATEADDDAIGNLCEVRRLLGRELYGHAVCARLVWVLGGVVNLL
ncbi:MAG: hypothetical protein ACKPKO_14955, partial [Candidatus Fonsibacter sp.]